MRVRIVVLVGMLLLAGCADESVLAPDYPTDPRAVPACERAAVARAIDTAYQGFDIGAQRAVHDSVYSECLRWKQR